MTIRLRSTTYANVTATAALVIALGGTSYAAVSLGRNTVGSAQVKNHSLLAQDVKSGELTRGAFGSTLPKGATLRGSWGQSFTNPADLSDVQTAPVSFGVPLKKNVKARVVQQGDPSTPQCPGTVTSPKAAKGFFCIYVGAGANHVNVNTYAAVDGGTPGNFKFGGVVFWRPTAVNQFTFASGTYAVTAR